jgi:hypothetical protein
MKHKSAEQRQLALRKPKKLGRRTLYTPQLQKRICQLLAKGNTIIAICDHVAISTTTFHQWCEDHDIHRTLETHTPREGGSRGASTQRRLEN